MKNKITYSENIVSEGFLTYNETGLTYNEAGYTYGGADRHSSPAPRNYSALISKPKLDQLFFHGVFFYNRHTYGIESGKTMRVRYGDHVIFRGYSD